MITAADLAGCQWEVYISEEASANAGQSAGPAWRPILFRLPNKRNQIKPQKMPKKQRKKLRAAEDAQRTSQEM